MTIAQSERFYEQDLKKYNVAKNKELLTWLKGITKNGYYPFIDIEELQQLINNIVYWYEMKYPEREMQFYEGTIDIRFKNIETLSKVMDIQQLMYRLPHNQLCLMQCNYRSNGGGLADIYNDKREIIGHKAELFMSIYRKNCKRYDELGVSFSLIKLPSFLLIADADGGKVNIDHDLKEYVNKESITLDELLVLFKEKYSDELDFTKLEECIYEHNCDIELRRRILQLVALKLLYSKKTIPERGYERAKRFINEFNQKLGLNLSTQEIDEAISKDYANGERWEEVRKVIVDVDGNEYPYLTFEDVSKNEQQPSTKSKGLIKSLFQK